jgi:hypothetical protein
MGWGEEFGPPSQCSRQIDATVTDAVALANLIDPSTRGLFDKSQEGKVKILFTAI